MENGNNSSEFKDFVKKIIAVDIGIFLVAAVVALSLRINLSIILFVVGITVAAFGAFLAGPRPYAQRFDRPQQFNPNEKLSARILHTVGNSLPNYAVENVLLVAGLLATGLSLPFICQIMF